MLDLDLVQSLKYGDNFKCYRDGELPCLICGKAVKDESAAKRVHLHEGGQAIVTAAEAEELNANGHDNADLGVYPIGPDCYRRHKKLLAPYVIE